MAKVSFRLFDVEWNEKGVPFSDAIDHILNDPAEDRIVRFDEHDGMLTSVKDIRKIRSCVFSRIRMDDIPSAINRKGVKSNLSLADDQGINEEMAVAFDPTLKVAAVQTSGYAFSHGTIASYFNQLCPGLDIRFIPIISPEIVKRFHQIDVLRRVTFRIAKTTNLDYLKSCGISEGEKIAIQEFMKAPYLEMTLSVGRGGRNTSIAKRVRSVVNALTDAVWKKGVDGIDKIIVSGKNEATSKPDTINLLSEQVKHEDNVNTIGRTIDTDHLRRVSVNAIIVHTELLISRNVA